MTASPLRIACLCEFPTLQGGEYSLLAALQCLRGRIEPVFLAPSTGRLADAVAAEGWPLLAFDVRDAAGVRRPESELLAELGRLFHICSADLLHANSLAMGRLAGGLAGRMGRPCTAHLRDMLRLSRAAVDRLNSLSGLAAVSTATRAWHVAQGLDAGRVQVVYNGVDVERFRPPAAETERTRLHHELGLPPDALPIVTIGQIGLRKGLETLAAAAPAIAAIGPRVHFVIVGARYSDKPESVELEQRLRSSFESPRLSPRCTFSGYRDDVPALLRSAALLVHPARQEPFGRVLLEAAATGLAIVATDVGGTSEMLENEVSALLIPPGDADALCAAVARMLADASLRRRLGAAARQRAAACFSSVDRSEGLLQFWQAVLAGDAS